MHSAILLCVTLAITLRVCALTNVQRVVVLRDTCARSSLRYQLNNTDITANIIVEEYASCNDDRPKLDDALYNVILTAHNLLQPTLVLDSQIQLVSNQPAKEIDSAIATLKGGLWDAIGVCDCSTVAPISTDATLQKGDSVCISGFMLSPLGAAKLLGVDYTPKSVRNALRKLRKRDASDGFTIYNLRPYIAKVNY